MKFPLRTKEESECPCMYDIICTTRFNIGNLREMRLDVSDRVSEINAW